MLVSGYHAYISLSFAMKCVYLPVSLLIYLENFATIFNGWDSLYFFDALGLLLLMMN